MSAALSLAVSMFLCATLERRVLAQALARLKHVLPRRASLPALECVLIEGAGNVLHLAATDGSTFVRVVVPATVATPGCLLLPLRRLAEITRSPGSAKIHLAGDRIVVGAANHRVVTYDPATFPALAAPEGELVGWFDRAALSRMLGRTTYAMSSDDTRPHLSALLFERRNGNLALVSTDGHRLALAQRPDEGCDAKVLVGRRTVEELARLAASPGAAISMRSTAERVWFASAGEWVSGPVIDALFPAYEQVIPETSRGRVRFATVDLREAVSALAPKGAPALRLAFQRDLARVLLCVEDGDGNSTETSTMASFEGELPAAIGVNAQYLREAIDVLEEEDGRVVTIECNGELDPVQIDGEHGTIGVVMPMRL